MAEPHPAFPSIGASSSRSSTGLLKGSDVSQILSQTKPLTGVRHQLIPAFERLIAQSDPDTTDSILCQPDHDLAARSDDNLTLLAVPLVYVLNARLEYCNRARTRDQALLDLCIRFVGVMDGRYLDSMLPRVSQFSWSLLHLAQGMNKLDQVLAALHRLTMATPQHCLAGTHAAFLEACLLTRSYEGALSLIREIYTDVKIGGCTYLDIITFYHHAGLIAAATRDFALASELFSIVVSVPTHKASAIQAATAKRAILCELLATGTRYQPPKATSHLVTRNIEKSIVPYVKLAKAFEAKDWDEVEKIAEDEKKGFEKDCNGGLVNQVVGAVLERKILKTRTVYTRLNIDQLVAKIASSRSRTAEEVIAKLNDMISTGVIQATISNDSPAIITFIEDTPAEPGIAIERLSQMSKMASVLERHLEHSSREMGVHPRYLQKQANILDITGNGRGQGMGRGNDDFMGRGQGDMAVDSFM